jgi:hypothetical protein
MVQLRASGQSIRDNQPYSRSPGVYRLSGVKSSIKDFYVAAFLKRKRIDFDSYPIRSVTSALKKYFRDLEVDVCRFHGNADACRSRS